MIKILYSDAELIVVDKPPELLSVPGRGPEKQDCVWRRIQQSYPTARVVHRLDFSTSGVMILALTADSQRHLNKQFEQRIIKKLYQAIVFGEPEADEGEVIKPLRCDWPRRPLQIVDHEQGKFAHTYWRKMSIEALGTRIELKPITGRSHQLRVHMQHLGCPIVGDRFYSSAAAQKLSPRLLLHAQQVEFLHPITEQPLQITAPLPF